MSSDKFVPMVVLWILEGMLLPKNTSTFLSFSFLQGDVSLNIDPIRSVLWGIRRCIYLSSPAWDGISSTVSLLPEMWPRGILQASSGCLRHLNRLKFSELCTNQIQGYNTGDLLEPARLFLVRLHVDIGGKTTDIGSKIR